MNRYLCCEWSGRARSSFRSRCVDAVAVAVVAVAVAADADADAADNIPELSKKCHNRKPSVLPLRATQKNFVHTAAAGCDSFFKQDPAGYTTFLYLQYPHSPPQQTTA